MKKKSLMLLSVIIILIVAALWTKDISVAANFVAKSTCSGSVVYDDIAYNLIESNGQCWLDKNLGAEKVCESPYDKQCFGDLYQWGRLNDGHQHRNSSVTNELSKTDIPGHSSFILATKGPYDWREAQNNSLWDPLSKIANNPCPSGFRVPSMNEFYIEASTWKELNIKGAFRSALKLPIGGERNRFNKINEPNTGFIWSGEDTYPDPYAQGAYWSDVSAGKSSANRGVGRPVRCIKY